MATKPSKTPPKNKSKKPTRTPQTTKASGATKAINARDTPAKKRTPKATIIPTKRAKTSNKTGVAKDEPSVSRVRKPKVVTGFVDFLREQSVVGLAVGLVIGTQVKALADQLIASFINPLIGLLLPGRGALDQKIFMVHFNEKAASFAWGSFVATLLSFITTAAVVYFVFKSLKLDKLTKKKDDK